MLNKDKLIHNIRTAIDEEYSDFIGFPESYEEAIIRWTFIFSDYYKDVQPKSSKVETSKLIFSALMKTFENKWKTDENLAEDLLYYSLKGEWMPKRMEEIFIVEDDYCSNGKLSFDKKGKKWRLI